MVQEINWAALEKQMQENPTLEMCRRNGATHYAYGWSRTPYGSWSDVQKEAYFQGYDAAKKEHK